MIKSLLYKLHIKKKEKRPAEDSARADWGPQMLDSIIPSLQNLGRQVLPTLPLLSQEGKRHEVGARGLNLQRLGGEAEDLLPCPVEWPCHLSCHPVITAGSCWIPKDKFLIYCHNKG